MMNLKEIMNNVFKYVSDEKGNIIDRESGLYLKYKRKLVSKIKCNNVMDLVNGKKYYYIYDIIKKMYFLSSYDPIDHNTYYVNSLSSLSRHTVYYDEIVFCPNYLTIEIINHSVLNKICHFIGSNKKTLTLEYLDNKSFKLTNYNDIPNYLNLIKIIKYELINGNHDDIFV